MDHQASIEGVAARTWLCVISIRILPLLKPDLIKPISGTLCHLMRQVTRRMTRTPARQSSLMSKRKMLMVGVMARASVSKAR